MKAVCVCVILGTLLMIAALQASAVYPDRPIRIIVPYAPGGNVDITARLVAPGLGENLGVPVVVDNRGGAGGTTGTKSAAKGTPDGYTLLLGSSGVLAAGPSLYSHLGFDPLHDFAYTSLVSVVPLVLEVNPSLPVKSVKQLIALAKAHPGNVTFGSAGYGTIGHLAGEYFQGVAHVKLLHVPYKGSGPALIDLIGGQIDMMFDQVSSSIGYVQSGKLRGLAVTTLKRASAMPNSPTLDELGLKGFEAGSTSGILLPAATPKDIVQKVYAALVKVLQQPATRASFTRIGANVEQSTPEEFARVMRGETEKWTKVIREAHIKPID